MSIKWVHAHLRRKRKVLVVQMVGKTPRGQTFLLDSLPLEASGTADPSFKSELERVILETVA